MNNQDTASRKTEPTDRKQLKTEKYTAFLEGAVRIGISRIEQVDMDGFRDPSETTQAGRQHNI